MSAEFINTGRSSEIKDFFLFAGSGHFYLISLFLQAIYLSLTLKTHFLCYFRPSLCVFSIVEALIAPHPARPFFILPAIFTCLFTYLRVSFTYFTGHFILQAPFPADFLTRYARAHIYIYARK